MSEIEITEQVKSFTTSPREHKLHVLFLQLRLDKNLKFLGQEEHSNSSMCLCLLKFTEAAANCQRSRKCTLENRDCNSVDDRPTNHSQAQAGTGCWCQIHPTSSSSLTMMTASQSINHSASIKVRIKPMTTCHGNGQHRSPLWRPTILLNCVMMGRMVCSSRCMPINKTLLPRQKLLMKRRLPGTPMNPIKLMLLLLMLLPVNLINIYMRETYVIKWWWRLPKETEAYMHSIIRSLHWCLSH